MTELRRPLLQATTVATTPTTAITQRLFFIMNLRSRKTTCLDRHEVLSRCARCPKEWRGPESNRRHHGFQPCALPTELPRQAAYECTQGFSAAPPLRLDAKGGAEH